MSDAKLFLSAVALFLAGAVPVRASTPDPLLAQIMRCSAMTADSDRLACFDAVAGSAGKAAAPKTAAGTGSTAAVAATPGAAAGFGVHNGPLEAKQTPQRQKRMLAVVGAVSHRGSGELVVTLDNGQVWVQNLSSDYPLKPGDRVEIDVGALGSYVLWTPSLRRATKVTRIS